MEIISIQETRVRQRETKYLKNPKLGQAFISSGKKKKNGVAIFVKNNITAKEIMNDENGRFIGIEIEINGRKTLMAAVYGPLQGKSKFYQNLKKKIAQFNYDQYIFMGDWNGVIDPLIDRQSRKKIQEKQGKLPNSFFELLEFFALIDPWRVKYPNVKDYTFFSMPHTSASRIDMFLVTSNF